MNEYNEYRPPRNEPDQRHNPGGGHGPEHDAWAEQSGGGEPPPAQPPTGHHTQYFSGEPTASAGYDEAGYYNVPDTTMLLVWSIASMLCCCQPLGIVAIVFAALAKGAADAGNYAEAEEKANKAKLFCWIAFGLGLVVWLGYFGFVVLMAAAGA